MPLEWGSTFINNKYNTLSPHLWIVLSDPLRNSDKVVIANATTWKDDKPELNDPSCILQVGEHDFIKHKSYVFYRNALCPTLAALEAALAGGVLVPNKDCSDELMAKVLLGAANSQYTSNEILGVLREQGLID